MTYLTDYDLIFTTTNDLHKKTARAVDVAARAVAYEDPGTSNHVLRERWAKWVRQNVDRLDSEAHRAMPYLLDDTVVATSGNNVPDDYLQNVFNGNVDKLADGSFK